MVLGYDPSQDWEGLILDARQLAQIVSDLQKRIQLLEERLTILEHRPPMLLPLPDAPRHPERLPGYVGDPVPMIGPTSNTG